jgi:hypothetical protein
MARTGINYGASGVFKTTAAKHFARYIYQKTGKGTLLFSMDGGGWAPLDPEIRAGVVQAYRGNMEIPLPVLRRVSQGYWPEDVSASEATKVNLRRVDWSQWGGMIVEGLTSISQALMRHLADKQIKTGEEATSPFTQRVIVDGQVVNETFAGNSKAHYGFVQNTLYSLVTNFSSLPCEYVLFTALESRTEEDDRSTIYGPQIAGKKATALVPSWVGDCLHSEGYPVETVVQVPDPKDAKKLVDSTMVDTKVRTYFVKHPDPSTGIMFPAKPRVAPEKVAELMKKFPGGYYEPTTEHGLDIYLQTIDALNAEQGDEVAKWRAAIDQKFGRGQQAVAAAK